MATSFNKAGIVRVGVETTASDHYMHYEMPGEKTQPRKRQDAVSNPNVRSKNAQGNNADNISFFFKKPVSDNGAGLATFTRPVISDSSVATSAVRTLKQPNLALFNSLAENNDINEIIRGLQGVDINQRMENDVTMLEAALLPKTHKTLAQALIKMEARFDLLETRHYGMVFSATKVGDRSLLNYVLSKVVTDDSECPDLFDYSPSLYARQDMHFAFAYAISFGWLSLSLDLKKSIGTLDPSGLNGEGMQILFSDAVASSNLELIKWVWDAGRVNADLLSQYDCPVLSTAVENSAKDVVEFLLSKGASVTRFDNHAVRVVLRQPGKLSMGKEEATCDKKRIEILNMLLDAKDVAIDFTKKISVSHDKSCTLYELAAEAGSEFVSCLAQAQLRQASKRTGVPLDQPS
jgi:hypothetical protein